MSRDGVQILKWPWSLFNQQDQSVPLGTSAAIVPYTGTAFLACPHGMKVTPVGGSSDLSRLSEGDVWDIHELPQVSVDSSDKSLFVHGDSGRWEVVYTGACKQFKVGDLGGNVDSSELLSVLDWWLDFDEIAELSIDKNGVVNWDSVINWLGLEEEEEGQHDPRRALIIKITEEFSRTILDNARHLRRILLRDHGPVPVHEIRQFDDKSMRWYVRQPGETLAEKAGPEQKVFSVIREETFNTLENRVFKDFLDRCIKAANRYVIQFEPDFPRSKRIQDVKKYQYLCHQAKSSPEFDEVKKPLPGVQANYVLQSDERYRKVWHWYKELLRDQDSEEEVWNWQGRLWADVCRLLVGAAVQYFSSSSHSHPEPEGFVRSSFKVSEMGRLGARLSGTWAPGPRLIGRQTKYRGVLSVVDASELRKHPIVQHCNGLGGQTYLIEEGVGPDSKNIKIVVVWTINTMASVNSFDKSMATDSAYLSLVNAQKDITDQSGLSIRMSGLILVNHQGTVPSQETVSLEQDDIEIACIDVGSDSTCWGGAVQLIAERLESWF